MEVFSTVEGLRKSLDDCRRAGQSIGFVPTMGALHEGHLSLVKRAAAECDVVVMSIFVNPLQFGRGEDLDVYPRQIKKDRELASAAGVNLLFNPDVMEMYPLGELRTVVAVPELSARLEGNLRPGHFAGVATVVAKLFSIVGSSRVYFGEKDWQQLVVVTQLAADLSLPVEVVPCPIVRDADGLALSSRNVYLSPKDREAALLLSQSLFAAVKMIDAGEHDIQTIKAQMQRIVLSNPDLVLNYIDIVDSSMQSAEHLKHAQRILVSANVGSTHLIDNVGIPQI